MRKIYTLALTILFLTFAQAQKTTLSLKLETGKEYKQKTDSKVTIEQDVSGQKMSIAMNIKGSMSYLVKSFENSNYDLEVEYESLSMIMDMPQGKMEFSSENKDSEDVFSKIVVEMVNKPFQVIMTNTGKIIKVNGIETLFDTAFEKFPQIPEAQLNQIKAQLMNAYGEKAFKGNIEMISSVFPKNPVIVDESWVINTKLESGFAADVTTTYTFKEENQDYHLIIGSSKIKTTDKDAYIKTNGMDMKYDLTGAMTSEIKLDKTSGWIIEAKMDQKIQGDAHIKENEQIPNGMKIPMIIKSETVITN